MSTFYKRVELLANVAIIIIALFLGVVLTQRYLTRDSRTQIKLGGKVPLAGVDWKKNDQTLLFVLSDKCSYCSRSADFYQRLVREATNGGTTGLVAVLPQSIDEGKKYLGDINVSINQVMQATPASLGIKGTPTLILTDNTGTVKNMWVGMLPIDRESEVLRHLQARCSGLQPCS